MIRVTCVVEGETEREFCKHFLSSFFSVKGITLIPTLVNNQGGNLNYPRVRRHLQNLLKSDQGTYITTFVDFYGLRNTFPCFEKANEIKDLYKKIDFLEIAFKEDICGKNFNFKNRFFPHIQPHEFEALLFSDVEKLSEIFPQEKDAKNRLLKVRKEFSPEYINGTKETSPSHRLKNILITPRYNKVTHGLQACQKIGLEKILSECQHFKSWHDKMLALKPLDKESPCESNNEL